MKLGAAGILVLTTGRYASAVAKNPTTLRIIATTDVHSFLTDFDYYKDAPTEKFGFARTATLIDQARKEAVNSVLVDNGDLIRAGIQSLIINMRLAIKK